MTIISKAFAMFGFNCRNESFKGSCKRKELFGGHHSVLFLFDYSPKFVVSFSNLALLDYSLTVVFVPVVDFSLF